MKNTSNKVFFPPSNVHKGKHLIIVNYWLCQDCIFYGVRYKRYIRSLSPKGMEIICKYIDKKKIVEGVEIITSKFVNNNKIIHVPVSLLKEWESFSNFVQFLHSFKKPIGE